MFPAEVNELVELTEDENAAAGNVPVDVEIDKRNGEKDPGDDARDDQQKVPADEAPPSVGGAVKQSVFPADEAHGDLEEPPADEARGDQETGPAT